MATVFSSAWPVTPWRGVAYAEGIDRQRAAVAAVAGDPDEPERLFAAEHPPTITLGRAGGADHLRVDAGELARRGVTVLPAARGGDVTWHGPGQWTFYPILRLAARGGGLRAYLRDLEETTIRWLAGYGVAAWREEGRTGVWTARGKLAAVGVSVTRWVTWHGTGVNVAPDLTALREWMHPCGLTGAHAAVTSLAECLGAAPPADEARERWIAAFGEVFGPPRTGQSPTPANSADDR